MISHEDTKLWRRHSAWFLRPWLVRTAHFKRHSHCLFLSSCLSFVPSCLRAFVFKEQSIDTVEGMVFHTRSDQARNESCLHLKLSPFFSWQVSDFSHEGTKARRHEDFRKAFRGASFSVACENGSLQEALELPFSSLLSFLRAFVHSCLRVKKCFSPFRLGASFCLFITVLVASQAGRAAEETVVSSCSSFKIVQHSKEEQGAFFWTSSLVFSGKSKKTVALCEGTMWPALFYISPDEQWVFQIQKTGSGDNNGFLYRIEPNGRVWQMKESLLELALEFMGRDCDVGDLYHTGVDFVGWDLKAGVLKFTLHGAKNSGGRILRNLAYNLKNHTIEP